jgi:hypothetical protein
MMLIEGIGRCGERSDALQNGEGHSDVAATTN